MKNAMNTENQIKNSMIDKVIFITAIFILVTYVFAEIRAINIGWTMRDVGQTIFSLLIALLAIFRKYLPANKKIFILIVLLILGSIPGIYSLGMLAGTIFLFPILTVFIAIYYTKRATQVFIILSLLFIIAIAFKFSILEIGMNYNAKVLISNPFHWLVYIFCLGLYSTIGYYVIYSYRNTMQILIDKISEQRDELTQTNKELLENSQNVKRLQGLLPICASCKKIRDDKGYWNRLEIYIKNHSEARFTHGICPDCMKKLYPEEYDTMKDA